MYFSHKSDYQNSSIEEELIHQNALERFFHPFIQHMIATMADKMKIQSILTR